jgi:prepilin-type N-terminal cleavage/methylation domain-containing protein
MRTITHTKTIGFTLIEVMVAVFIMGLTMASAAVCFQLALQQYRSARALNHVTDILEDHVESVRLLNWADLNNLPSTQEIPLPAYLKGSGTPSNITVTRTISDSNLNDLKIIIVTAEWDTTNGKTQRRSIELNYTYNGVNDYYYGLGNN